MIANHIHDALAQVGKLQEYILARRLFKGYSGRARIASGGVALAGAAIMAAPGFPGTVMAHLAGWAVVLGVGVLVNYGALAYWFLFDGAVRRNPVMLRPAVDALPALGVGAVLTVVLILGGQFDMLFGMWMSMYGLAQVAYRQSLPRGIYLVGLGYVLCGTISLLAPYSDLPLTTGFMNPWPMGLVFFVGEISGGVILRMNEKPEPRREMEEE